MKDKLNKEIKLLKDNLVDSYAISTDRDLFRQLGITDDEDKCKIFAWVNYQCAFSIKEGYEYGYEDGSEKTTERLKESISNIFNKKNIN